MNSGFQLLMHIDTTRNDSSEDFLKQIITERYGTLGYEQKLHRYMQLDPPNLQLVTDFTDMYFSTLDAYTSGLFYPALVSSCALGEQIYKILIRNLKDYYKTSKHYKNAYRDRKLSNWDIAIEILQDWNLINDAIASEYKELKKIRNSAIHFDTEIDVESNSLKSITSITKIVRYFFGINNDIFKLGKKGTVEFKPGAIELPIVKEFYLKVAHFK